MEGADLRRAPDGQYARAFDLLPAPRPPHTLHGSPPARCEARFESVFKVPIPSKNILEVVSAPRAFDNARQPFSKLEYSSISPVSRKSVPFTTTLSLSLSLSKLTATGGAELDDRRMLRGHSWQVWIIFPMYASSHHLCDIHRRRRPQLGQMPLRRRSRPEAAVRRRLHVHHAGNHHSPNLSQPRAKGFFFLRSLLCIFGSKNFDRLLENLPEVYDVPRSSCASG